MWDEMGGYDVFLGMSGEEDGVGLMKVVDLSWIRKVCFV